MTARPTSTPLVDEADIRLIWKKLNWMETRFVPFYRSQRGNLELLFGAYFPGFEPLIHLLNQDTGGSVTFWFPRLGRDCIPSITIEIIQPWRHKSRVTAADLASTWIYIPDVPNRC
jgi:hypothetical protein